MTTNELTPQEVIELRELFPEENLLTLNVKKAKKNKSADFPTHYVPILIKRKGPMKNGKPTLGPATGVYMKFSKAVCGSSCKLAPKSDAATARYMQIAFRDLSKEDFEQSDYPPKHWEILQKETALFNQALTILSEEYVKMLNAEKKATRKYRQGKTVFNFIQTHRNMTDEEKANRDEGDDDDDDDNDVVPLDNPLIRIRINVDYQTRKFGWMSQKDGFMYSVFDGRKKRTGGAHTPARVKTGGVLTDLNTNNAGAFITFMSLTGGVVALKEVCFSGSGISPFISFHQLHVWPHRRMVRETMNDEELDEMDDLAPSGFDSDEDAEETNDDPTSKSIKTRKVLPDSDDDADDDDDDDADDEDYEEDDGEPESDEEFDDEEETVPVKPAKKNKLKSGRKS